MSAPNILVAYGTRPEAIKVAPVVAALKASSRLQGTVVVTGQHRAILDQVNDLFGIEPSYDLDIIQPRQQLHEITTRALGGMIDVLQKERPDGVLVQGDTTTTFVAALAAHYERVPVFHLEAGLRTDERYNPFPEEMNRRLTTQLSVKHFAPTSLSRQNLLRDGIDPRAVVITGNTVIDALLDVVARQIRVEQPDLKAVLGQRMVLVTSHRRESWGAPMARTAAALATLATRFPDICFLLPAHPNPVVREVLVPPLQGLENVVITDPLNYSDFAQAMNGCELVLTDSGGVQEEAPSLGKPVLVLRENTERPEAVTAGTARLVGTDEQRIVDSVSELLTDRAAYEEMAHAVNPYGDGRAAARVEAALAHYFELGEPPDEFDPISPKVFQQD